MSSLPTFLKEHRRFLIVDEILVATGVNFLLNAGIAWFLFRSASVPFRGSSGIAADMLGTAFLMPLLTSLIAMWLVPWQVNRGVLPRIPEAELRTSAWRRRPGYQRGILLGLLSMVLIAVPSIALFAHFGPAQLSRGHFIWLKASFAAGVGALVTPLLGWWALVEASRAERVGAQSLSAP
jgi:hypothetical protein